MAPYLLIMLDFLAIPSETKKPFAVLKYIQRERRKEIKEELCNTLSGAAKQWNYKESFLFMVVSILRLFLHRF